MNHLLILYQISRYLSLVIDINFHISSFVLERHNDIAPAHFRYFFRPISSIHSYNTRGATRGDFFLSEKHTTRRNMFHLLIIITVLGYRIISLMESEIQYLLKASEKKN